MWFKRGWKKLPEWRPSSVGLSDAPAVVAGTALIMAQVVMMTWPMQWQEPWSVLVLAGLAPWWTAWVMSPPLMSSVGALLRGFQLSRGCADVPLPSCLWRQPPDRGHSAGVAQNPTA